MPSRGRHPTAKDGDRALLGGPVLSATLHPECSMCRRRDPFWFDPEAGYLCRKCFDWRERREAGEACDICGNDKDAWMPWCVPCEAWYTSGRPSIKPFGAVHWTRPDWAK